MVDHQLDDRVAVVTGGASGIGRGICLAFAEAGADVVVADLQAEPREGGTPPHEAISDETDATGVFVECDVTDRDALQRAGDRATDLGGLDVWVNCAGLFRGESFLEADEAHVDQLIDVNIRGTYFGSQVAIGHMVEGDGGSVINLSSIAGLRGSGDFVTYCATKGAVRLMTYALADRFGASDVRVNAIHPGIIETSMVSEDVPIVGGANEEAFLDTVPMGRFGTPEDVAGAAVFLASDAGAYVNGESLVVDGGYAST